MAEWFMEGYINRLLDEHDPIVRQLRREATFYCVPNMCPGEMQCFLCGLQFFNIAFVLCSFGDDVVDFHVKSIPPNDLLFNARLTSFPFTIVLDGAFRGHLRTNACGANLNREWCTTGDYIAPTLERSPEVYHGM